MKGRENTSAPQNGISSQTQQGIPPQGFQNHIPARGRKLFESKILGRERHDFKTISPQGDGNRFSPTFIAFFTSYFKTISPQGDGNTYVSPFGMSRTSYFKTISPQGDGNDPAPEGLPISSLFQNHIPARGRKLHPEIILLCRCRILKPYPRKGTETYNRRTNHASSRISKPYPRKGTETPLLFLRLTLHVCHFKTISP